MMFLRKAVKSIPGLRALNVARIQFLIRWRNQRSRPKDVEAEDVSCPLCAESARFTVVYRPYFASPLKIVRCGGCGLRFLRPMPTQSYYDHYYSTRYFGLIGRSEAKAVSADAKRVYRAMQEKADLIFAFVSPLLSDREELTSLHAKDKEVLDVKVEQRNKLKKFVALRDFSSRNAAEV